MLNLLKTQLKLIFQNKAAILVMVALPVLLTWFIAKADTGSSQYTLYVSDADNTGYSGQLISLLQKQDNLKIIKTSETDLDGRLRAAQTIDVALKIDKGFSQSLSSGGTPKIQLIQMYDSAGSTISTQAVTNCCQALSDIVSGAKSAASVFSETADTGKPQSVQNSIATSAVNSMKNKSQISVQSASISHGTSKSMDNTSRTFLGFIILFLWVVVIQGCRPMIDEKENRTYERMLSTPVSYWKVLFSKFISVYLYGIVNVVIVLWVGKQLFHLQCFANIGSIFLILAAYLLAIIGITLVCTARAKNQQLFTSIGMPAAVLAGMLGGCFFPIEIAPGYIQILSRFTPQGWAMPAITGTYAANSASVLSTSCLILTAAGISLTAVFFLLYHFRLVKSK